MNTSVYGAQRIKDAKVWFIQITIPKYLFNKNKRHQRNFLALGFVGGGNRKMCKNLYKNAREKCATHTHILEQNPPTHTPASATIKYQRAADLGGYSFFWSCYRSPSFWGNAKLRYNGINLNKCRSQDFYAFLPHNKYFCCSHATSILL